MSREDAKLIGAASTPDPGVFAWSAATVKACMAATHLLGGRNYVLWGGREGYETLLNTDLARERHEFRQFRLEREKQEKAEKLAAKAAAKRAELAAETQAGAPAATAEGGDADTKKALIAAALARAQAKQTQAAPKNTDNLSAEQRHEIEAIEARRAKIRELARKPLESEEDA